MNFFAHAVLSDQLGQPVEVRLGSMLPDLFGMMGARRVGVNDPLVQRGIALHHQADAVFHDSPWFLGACHQATDALLAAGLPRGAAHAVAHVGIELLLDGAQADLHDQVVGLHQALHLGQRMAAQFAWPRPGQAAQFATLLERLATSNLPGDYQDDRRTAARLRRLLAGRPRLAFGEDHEPLVRDWLASTRPQIQAATSGVMAQVFAALALPQ